MTICGRLRAIRPAVHEQEASMESEFMLMAYGIALVFCAIVSVLAVFD